MVRKKIILAVTAIAVISFGILGGCQKETKDEIFKTTKSIPIQKNDLGMLYFENFDVLMEVIDEIHAMDYIDRAAYEDANGFTSYGRQCDDIYYPSVDEESDASLQTDEEIDAFVEEHNEYVQLMEDYDGESLYVPRLFDHPFRYFITKEDRIFQIEDTYIKVFESGIVSTDVDYLNELKNLREEELPSITENNDIFCYSSFLLLSQTKHKVAVRNNYYFGEARNSADKERIRIESKVVIDGNKKKTKASYYISNSIKPFHKLGKNWHLAKRTVNYYIDFKYSFNSSPNNDGYPIFYDRIAYIGSNKSYGSTIKAGKLNNQIVHPSHFNTAYTLITMTGYVSIPAVRHNF